jgi:hypothetical protein
MSIAYIVGPAAALIGIMSVFFVMRRKSVEKRSMYSARRSQIEHKVRAARQRTLTPHGRVERPAEAPAEAPAASPTWGPPQATPMVTYEPSAFESPPAAAPPPPVNAPKAPGRSPWDVGPTAPESQPEPFMPAPEPFTPAPQPTFPPAPSPAEPAWTPGPASAGAATPFGPAQPAASAPANAGWSVVSDTKDAAMGESQPKKKDKKGSTTSAWSLASGDAPGSEPDGGVKKPSAAVAIAQYAVFVVGLIMVLIGILVMVASHA